MSLIAQGTIHSVRETFEKEECEAVLLIDAENAFNRCVLKLLTHILINLTIRAINDTP